MAFALNQPSAPLGVRNAVLCATARRHSVADYPGPLSIKSVTRGIVAWKTGGRELVVDCDAFLVLHHGEPYSMNIDAREPVSTLCVFFAPGFVRLSYATSMDNLREGSRRLLEFVAKHADSRPAAVR